MVPADNTNLSLIPFPTMDLHSNSIPKKKKTKGRRKIEIMKIENKNRKNVTFTKRRKGLFKKAGEIGVLCGATVAVIVFSEAGKVFPFGHPSVEGIIDRYIHGSFSNAAVVSDQRRWWDRSIEELGFEQLEPFGAALMELRNNLERRIMDLEWQSSEFDDALLVQQRIAPRCNMNGVSVWPEFVSNYNDQQYQYGGCGCMGISSTVAMANPN